MRNTRYCIVNAGSVVLVRLCWCYALLLILAVAIAEESDNGPYTKLNRLATKLNRFARSYTNKFSTPTEYEQYEDYDTPTLASEDYADNVTDTVQPPQDNCHCTGNDDCSSGQHGGTYRWKAIFPTPDVKNITEAIYYADTFVCLKEEGFLRVALETEEELHFLVTCLLCNKKTSFGSSQLKKNIMTAGTVDVTEDGSTAQQVLQKFLGTWSSWDEDMVDGRVPKEVVLLDHMSGDPIGNSVLVPQGSYAVLLVGNERQQCDDGDTYYNWGLMPHTADGSLENLVSFVVCERPNERPPFMDSTTTDSSTETSFTTDTESSTETTFTSTESSTETTFTTSTESLTETTPTTSTESSTEITFTSTESSTEITFTSTESSTETTPTTSTESSTEITFTSTESSTETTPTTSTESSTETTFTSTESSTETTSTTSTESSTETTSTTSTESSTETTSTTSTESPTKTTNTESSTETSFTTITGTTTETTLTTLNTVTATTPTAIPSTTITTSPSAIPYTTTTTATTTTTTTTDAAAAATTTTSNSNDCCLLKDWLSLNPVLAKCPVVRLCPNDGTLSCNCEAGHTGSIEVNCEKEELIVQDLCIAEWINDVESMINTGNDSVVDIAEIVSNETEETSINQAELKHLVLLINDMTLLLEHQIESENNKTLKKEMAQNYTSELVKIEGNLFVYEGTWDSLDQESARKLGSSLLHDLEKTGFILAHNIENEWLNFTDPTLNLTVISQPRDELAGHELYVPGPVSDTFIYLPKNFEELLPNEIQVCLVGYFLDQSAASRALPVNNGEGKEINSYLVSMTVSDLNHTINFTPESGKVIIRLHHAYKESGPLYRNLHRERREGEVPSRIPGSAKCMYWDSTSSSWVTNGCDLINSTHDVTFCSCTHLSMFTVITDVHNYVGRDPVLDILSTVLSFLSCLALMLTASILQLCKGVKTNPRISITKQLCISLFFSHFIIILFLDQDFLKISAGGCRAVAVLLHYLLLASIFWMLAEGLQLFQSVHLILDRTSFMIAYWLIGYGTPIVVVLVTSLVAFKSGQWGQVAYAPDGSEYCWLSTDEGYIWAFTGPLSGVIVINTIFMVVALHSAAILRANKRKTLPQKILLWIKGSFSLNCILGVTWVFGLLYMNTNYFFAYAFTIFNASQGVMIFVFSCIMNENVRTAFVTSLPEKIKLCFKKKVSGRGTTSDERTSRALSRALTTFNRSSTCSPHPSHNFCQLQVPSPQALLYDNTVVTTLGHQRHLASRGRSLSDVTELERSRHKGGRKKAQGEEWRRPSLPAHMINEVYRHPSSNMATHGAFSSICDPKN